MLGSTRPAGASRACQTFGPLSTFSCVARSNFFHMTLFVLLRHLPTEDDVNNIYTSRHAQTPFATLAEGALSQLQDEITEFFVRHDLRHIYCSNNSRGIGTANTISAGLRCNHEIQVDSRLDNIHHPEWDGMHQDGVKLTPLYRVWHSRPTDAVFSNGESLRDVAQRVDSFLQSSAQAGGLIVSHTVPMQVLVCRLLGIDISRIWSFKFDHWKLTAVLDDILLRYNASRINDIPFTELRR